MNIFKQISYVSKAKKSWKEAKKLIDTNKGVAEEARQIFIEFKALCERAIKLLPPLQNTINGLLDIIKKVL